MPSCPIQPPISFKTSTESSSFFAYYYTPYYKVNSQTGEVCLNAWKAIESVRLLSDNISVRRCGRAMNKHVLCPRKRYFIHRCAMYQCIHNLYNCMEIFSKFVYICNFQIMFCQAVNLNNCFMNFDVMKNYTQALEYLYIRVTRCSDPWIPAE